MRAVAYQAIAVPCASVCFISENLSNGFICPFRRKTQKALMMHKMCAMSALCFKFFTIGNDARAL